MNDDPSEQTPIPEVLLFLRGELDLLDMRIPVTTPIDEPNLTTLAREVETVEGKDGAANEEDAKRKQNDECAPE